MAAFAVCVRTGEAWNPIFKLVADDDSVRRRLSDNVRVVDYTFQIPTSGRFTSVRLADDASKDAAAVKHYTGLAAYMAFSKSAGKPRAAVLQLADKSIVHLLPPTASADFSSSSSLRICLPAGTPPALPDAGLAAAPTIGTKRPRPADDLSAQPAAGGAAAGRDQRHSSTSAPPAAAGPWRYVIYPDYVPELLAAPLARRRGAWQDALAGHDPKAKGHWRVVEEAVAGNEWDFASKPAILYKPPAGSAAAAAAPEAAARSGGGGGLPLTLHNLVAAPGGRVQLVNHLPNPRAISSKASMWRALSAWYGALGMTPPDAGVPTTFILSSSRQDEFGRFAGRFGALHAAFAGSSGGAGVSSGGAPLALTGVAHDSISSSADKHPEPSAAAGGVDPLSAVAACGERMPACHVRRNIWIIKPEKLLGGQGIELASTPAEVAGVLDRVAAEGLKTSEGGRVAPGAEWIVQKYVEAPLLLEGRKFDIRIEALVTDAWDVYVYEDGFCRTSSLPYTLAEAGGSGGAGGSTGASDAGAGGGAPGPREALSKTAHVTNHCYQTTCSAYGAYEPSNLLSLDQLQTYLDLAYGEGVVSLRGHLWPRWVEMILNTVCAARASAMAGGEATPRRWFELIGFDFLIDEHLRSWLIEANTTPGVEGHCAYADAVYGRLVEDMYALAVDRHFPPRQAPDAMPPQWFPDSNIHSLPWGHTVKRKPLPAWFKRPWHASGGGHACVPRGEDHETHGTASVPGAAAAASVAAGAGAASTDAAAGLAYPPHPTGPRDGNRWQLVWSEGARDLLSIPHQAAVARCAINRAAVLEALKAEAAGEAAAASAGGRGLTPAQALAVAERHKLMPLLNAVHATGVAARSDAAEPAAVPTPAAAPSTAATGDPAAVAASSGALHWKPVLRRFIAREDAAWHYPLGVPPGVLSAPAVT